MPDPTKNTSNNGEMPLFDQDQFDSLLGRQKVRNGQPKPYPKDKPKYTIIDSTPGEMPLFGAEHFTVKKKEDGGEDYGTGSLSQLPSALPSPSVEKETPMSFLSRDIDNSLSFFENTPQFTFESLAQPTTPAAPQADRETIKANVLSKPEQFKGYVKNRINTLESEIISLNNKIARDYTSYDQTMRGVPSLQPTYKEGAQPLLDEINEKKKYLDDLREKSLDVASYLVPASKNIQPGQLISDSEVQNIGEEVLKIANDTGIADDVKVLRQMDASGASKDDAARTNQNIQYRLYKTGANALARYYNDHSEDLYEIAKPKIDRIQQLMDEAIHANKEDLPKYQSEKFNAELSELASDPAVLAYMNAQDSAAQYVKKSEDAINQFPQVKRRVLRQQMNDAYFNFLRAKESAGAAIPGNIGIQLGNWLFGDKATEEDVPMLAKAVGVSEDEARSIIASNIKGWFGGANEAGVRVPGLLPGIAQAVDQTAGQSIMGMRRFLNVDNVDAKNRALSDRMKDYNLKAQKAKLFDDAGKLNFNPYSVFNTMGEGIGQTSVYALPSMITGGFATGLSGSKALGKIFSVATTTGSSIGAYEDAYVEAGQHTDSEEKKRKYAMAQWLINGLSESILEPAEIAGKIGLGARAAENKLTFSQFDNIFKKEGPAKAMWESVREGLGVVGTENFEELAALISGEQAKKGILGVNPTPGDFINDAVETAVTTTLTTLPLGIGAGMNRGRDQSSIRKQALFEIGNEPDTYRPRLRELLDNGSIDQNEFNRRMAVVNTMASIVPTIKPEDANGRKLSYEQKAELAAQQFRILNNNEQLKSNNVVEAEKPIIEADNKDAIERQTAILTGEPIEIGEEGEESSGASDLGAEIKNKLGTQVSAGSDEDAMNYAIDKIAEAPTETREQLGDDLFNRVLEATPTGKLQSGLDFLLENNPDSPNVKILDDIISQREEQEPQKSTEQAVTELKDKALPYVIGEEERNIVSDVSQRMQNAEEINENDLESARNVLYDVLDKFPDNKSFSNLIEPLITQIEQYEFRTKSEAGTVTEEVATQTATDTRKRDFDKRPILEQLSAGNATIQKPDGTRTEGRLTIRDGKYEMLNQEGEVIASLGEKAINDRDVTLPSPEEVDNWVTLDENDNVTALTVKTKDGNLITFSGFKNPDVPLDLAIQMSANVIDVPNEVFDTHYETISKEVSREVPVAQPKTEPQPQPESTRTEVSDTAEPQQAAEAYEGSAERLEEQGDIEGAEKLREVANNLQNKTPKNATEQPRRPLRSESQRQQAKGAGDSNLPEVNEASVQDREANKAKKESGITHAQTTATAQEFGQPGYIQDTPQSIAEWDKEAESQIKAGYNISDLIAKMESGKYFPSAVEQRIMAKYISGIEAELESNPTPDGINKLMRAIRASDIAGGRETARSLVARRGLGVRDSSLAGFFVEQDIANDGEPLTEEQIKQNEKEYNEIKSVQFAYEQKVLELEKENAKLRADAALKQQQKTIKKQKKTHTDFVEERKKIISDIRKKFKQAGAGSSGLAAVPFPYAVQLIVIAPDVMKLTRSILEEGVTKLPDVVKQVHGLIKDSIDWITEKDIHDIIAGDYNMPKQTKSEINQQLSDLRTQAKLENKLDDLLSGNVKPKSKNETAANKEIQELKDKINYFTKIYKTQEVKDAESLKALKTRTQNEIKRLEGDLKMGNYQEPSLKKPALKLDKEAIDLKDKLVKLRNDRKLRLMQEKYNNRTKREKIKDRILEVANVPRTIMSSLDYSAPLRQAVIPTLTHPTLAAKAGVEMFRMSVSQKRFDRWFHDLRQTPRYELMQESGLYVADPSDPRLSAKEEAFMNNLAEKIPILGKLIKGSERAYVGYLNKMRVDLFNRFADSFEDEGLTYERNPELYTGLASFVNNFTGRGGLSKIESAAPILNSVFFSPRLIASRLNILGLSDLNPVSDGFYGKLPPKVRNAAWIDLLKFIGIGTTFLAMLAYGLGGDDDDDDLKVELNPRSTDFGKIVKGNTRWDIWGGFQQYIVRIMQIALGEKKAAISGNISKIGSGGKFGETRGDVVSRFVRGKLAPIPSAIWNILEGRDIVGEKATPKSEMLKIFSPLVVSDLKEAVRDKGASALFSIGVPSVFGVGVQTYLPRGYENVDVKSGIYKQLYEKRINISEPEQREMTDDQYKKFLPKRKKIFEDEWKVVIDKGALLNEDGNPTIDVNKARGIKPFDKLSYNELVKLNQSISNSATRKADKEIGYKKQEEPTNQEYIKKKKK